MPRSVRAETEHRAALRTLEVLRIADVTPGMRRVTLGGDQLGAFTTPDGIAQAAFRSDGFDDDVRLYFAQPGATEVVLPRLEPDGRLSVPREIRESLVSKVYTVRRYDAVSRELDLDFVKHGVGIATTWAYRARPGDRMNLAGPFESLAMPEGFDWFLVAGDDTALPAIGRMLEELPDDARAQVFIEVAEDAHTQRLRELPGVQVTWISRDGADAGSTCHLLDAVRDAEWWQGSVFGWIAGEQSVTRDLRRHLVDDRGLAKGDIHFTGYWKRQPVIALDADIAVPDLDRSRPMEERFHELTELVPPLAIRAAVSIGVAERLAHGTSTLRGLAAATGADERGLGKLLGYLRAIDLVDVDGKDYRLTALGEFMTYEHAREELHSAGHLGQLERGVLGLEQAVRSGAASLRSVTGRDYAALRADPVFVEARLGDFAEWSESVAQSILETGVLAGAERIVVHADQASGIAARITRADPDARVTIVALPTPAAWFADDLLEVIGDDAQRDRVSVRVQSAFEPTPEAERVLFMEELGAYPDAEAGLILRRAGESLAPGGRVLLVEATERPDESDDEWAGWDLVLFAATGVGMRGEQELAAVIEAAGLRTVDAIAFGWGRRMRVLAPAE